MTSATSTAVATTGAQQARQRRATSRGVSTLMYASQQGDVQKVRKIIHTQPNSLFDRDRTGKTPLHYCCTSDNICAAQTADLLVMAAPELVETHDEDGFTPLHLAVIAGNMQLVTFLLANKADVNAVDNEKHTVVHWAAVCGEVAALRAVLAAGAPVSTPDVHGGYPLHYAAQMCGNDKDSNLGLEVLQTLLTHSGVIVNVEDGDGRQPLLWAASAGSTKAVLALIRAGAGVESPDKDGLTALHCAASRGHTDCIDSLLTLCGASPDVIDSNGCTALHYAVTLGHADATALLLVHGADPNRQDRKGRSPAHCGCAKGQFETVKMISGHGANLWLKNARGDFPLHEATASGRRDLVKWLLEMRPSQVNARNNDGRCPLHLAALNDNADMCKILLDAGAQINPILRTSKNIFMTPLDCALQRGFRSTAKYLQLHGGVPANRLGEIRQGHQKAPNGINKQIKNDVTFWGDTSSDSDREHGDIMKSHKRLHRKKLIHHKFERKHSSVSSSEIENGSNLMKDKLESGKIKQKLSEKNKGGRTDSATSIIDSAKRNNKQKLSGRLDYTNQIVINGKTEINIHQTREIGFNEATTAALVEEKLTNKITVPTDETQGTAVEKEKRPKSAKYRKGRDKSGKSSSKEDSAKLKTKIDKSDQKNLSVDSNKVINTSEETAATAVKVEETLAKTELISNKDVPTQGEAKLDPSNMLPDQQSLISNTSEDVEEHKNLIVEAAVHEPPKSLEKSVDDAKTIGKAVGEESIQKSVDDEPKTVENVVDEATKKDGVVDDDTNKEINKEIKTSEPSKEEISDSKKLEETSNAKADIIEATKEEEKEIKGPVPVEEDASVAKKLPEPVVDVEQSEKYVQKEKLEKPSSKEIPPDDKQVNETVIQNEIVEKENEENKKTEDSQIVLESDKTVETEEQEIMKIEDSEKTFLEKPVDVEADAQKEQDLKANAVKKADKLELEKLKSDEEKLDQAVVDNQLLPTTDQEDLKIITGKNSSEATEKSKIDDQNTEPLNVEPEIQTNDIPKEKKLKTKTSKPKKEEQEIDGKYSDDFSSPTSDSSTSSSATVKEHKSFRILEDKEAEDIDKTKEKKSRRTVRKAKSPLNKQRSRSEENKTTKNRNKEHEKLKRSKIPTPLTKTRLSKSDKYLDIPDQKVQSSMESRVPSLPNIHESNKDRIREQPRSDSNMSAPLLASIYSDNERGSGSDLEDLEEAKRSSAARKRKVKKKSKTRDSRSAGSDYESSNIIDSGFEPSPRSSRIPKWRNMSDRGVNMTSVTQSIQSNIRRYHLERKIFQHLLDLKRLQIRAGQHNEAILVKRAIDAYHQSCASTVGAGKYIPEDYTLKSFEKFLYLSLRKLQRNGADHLKGLPETNTNPLLCTKSTHRCMHATHAYTGIPCAAYLPMMDHHTIPKIGFNSTQSKSTNKGFLPTINPKKAVTLELCHGSDKQVISLPADHLDQNKRYYVTFTVKGNETPSEEQPQSTTTGHRHAKSD